MSNPYFRFKQFTVHHDRCAMKVSTDACLFGAWVAHSISQKGKGKTRKLLDIGAGSGLLALMVAQKNEGHIDAVELDPDAAEQAAENVAATPWKDRIRVWQQDIRHFNTPEPYDVVFSNPPFYEQELQGPVAARNQAHHGTGLRLSDLAPLLYRHLAEEGIFYLLFPYKRLEEGTVLLQRHGLHLHETVIAAPSVHHPSFRVLLRGGKQPGPRHTAALSIRDIRNEYTPEFSELLKDYYLYL
ncbi:MAG TPA: methyltransferase [Chitinophagaceae bacterium]|nr:methyltransferase [Chitinophagaceae bacterium]